MTVHLTIAGRPISKKNSRRNFKNVSLPSVAYVKWEQEALKQLQWDQDPIKTPVVVKYYFKMKGKLDSDIDNLQCGVNDLLQKAGVIENDSQIRHVYAYKIPGCSTWETTVEIEELYLVSKLIF